MAVCGWTAAIFWCEHLWNNCFFLFSLLPSTLRGKNSPGYWKSAFGRLFKDRSGENPFEGSLKIHAISQFFTSCLKRRRWITKLARRHKPVTVDTNKQNPHTHSISQSIQCNGSITMTDGSEKEMCGTVKGFLWCPGAKTMKTWIVYGLCPHSLSITFTTVDFHLQICQKLSQTKNWFIDDRSVGDTLNVMHEKWKKQQQ